MAWAGDGDDWCAFPGDDSDSSGDPRGWDRASIAVRSKKTFQPDISQADLLLPNEASKMRAFAICAATAAMMSALYGFFPLFLVSIWLPLGGWYPWIMLTMFVALAIGLFVLSVFETRSLRRLAADL
jgi:hypothetical protein